jgi:DNA polymerase-4
MPDQRTRANPVFVHLYVHGLGASVEGREQGDPERGAVLLDGSGQRVVSASPAAFGRGVWPGMSRWEAEQRCPDLVAAEPDPDKYAYFRQRILDICGDYSPEVRMSQESAGSEHRIPRGVHPERSRRARNDKRGVGNDAGGAWNSNWGAWNDSLSISLDLTGTERLFGRPKAVAQEIRNRLRVEMGVVASLGIGPNPLVARLACDAAGPGEVVEVTPEQVSEFVGRLPIITLPGVEVELAERLNELGIRRAEELARLPAEAIERALGEQGRRLWEIARGEEPGRAGPEARSCPTDRMREVEGQEMEAIWAQFDLHPPTGEWQRISAAVRKVAEEAARKLRERGEVGQQLRVELVFRDLRTIGTRRTLRHATRSSEVIFHAAQDLLSRIRLNRRAVRRVRIRIGRLRVGPQGGQLALPLLEQERRRERLAEMVERARDRFGEAAVRRASLAQLVGR